MSLLLLFGGAGAGTQAGSVSYVGWWIGGQGSVPTAASQTWVIGSGVGGASCVI